MCKKGSYTFAVTVDGVSSEKKNLVILPEKKVEVTGVPEGFVEDQSNAGIISGTTTSIESGKAVTVVWNGGDAPQGVTVTSGSTNESGEYFLNVEASSDIKGGEEVLKVVSEKVRIDGNRYTKNR